MACKSKVAAVVGGNCHNGTGTVAGQHIVADVDGYPLAGQGVDGIGASENAADLFDLGLTLALRAVLGPRDVGLYFLLLLGRGNLFNQLVLRTQHHKGDAKDGVGTGGENFKS